MPAETTPSALEKWSPAPPPSGDALDRWGALAETRWRRSAERTTAMPPRDMEASTIEAPPPPLAPTAEQARAKLVALVARANAIKPGSVALEGEHEAGADRSSRFSYREAAREVRELEKPRPVIRLRGSSWSVLPVGVAFLCLLEVAALAAGERVDLIFSAFVAGFAFVFVVAAMGTKRWVSMRGHEVRRVGSSWFLRRARVVTHVQDVDFDAPQYQRHPLLTAWDHKRRRYVLVDGPSPDAVARLVPELWSAYQDLLRATARKTEPASA